MIDIGGAFLPLNFDWDVDNEVHLSRHGVVAFEAEEVMMDPNRVGFDVHDREKKGNCRVHRRWAFVVRSSCGARRSAPCHYG